jgi:hypothetical protein
LDAGNFGVPCADLLGSGAEDIPEDSAAARTDVPEELTSRSVKASAFPGRGGVAFANRSVA